MIPSPDESIPSKKTTILEWFMKKKDLFNFDNFVERRATASLKWEKYKGSDIIPLWVADMDFRSPPAVIRALQRHVAYGVFGYTIAPPEFEESNKRAYF